MHDLTPLAQPLSSTTLQPIFEQAVAYAANAKAQNTQRAYASAWEDFFQWCNDNKLPPLPATPEMVALFLTERAKNFKVSSLRLRLTAIVQAHAAAGHSLNTQHHTLKTVWQGIKRTKGTHQQGKQALLSHDIRSMVYAQPDTLQGVRNKAVILLGFASALRRSELVTLNVEDCTFSEEGMTLQLRRSKTDQEGEGRTLGVARGKSPATCPVAAVQGWLERAEITKGALFRSIGKGGRLSNKRLSDKGVAIIIKAAAHASGLDASFYAGHSLRAGHATSAAAAGVADHAIMQQTGHKSVAMLYRYIRAGKLFAENSSAGLGL